jgi:hypothetical protein
MDKQETSQKDDLVKSFDQKKKKNSSKFIVLLVVLVVLGSFGGYVLSKAKSGPLPSGSQNGSSTDSQAVTKGAVFGSNDTSTFKDTADGTLKTGGIEGEGQYHLERPGGESQFVYLTSSSVDLSKFVDKKIKIWGQTQAAQHAGWLMDVGRVEVE